jgi:hypothetical protein
MDHAIGASAWDERDDDADDDESEGEIRADSDGLIVVGRGVSGSGDKNSGFGGADRDGESWSRERSVASS